MKANELRIGNLVKAPLGEIAIIDVLGHFNHPEYIHGSFESESGSYFGQNGFEPIPLTPSVLDAIDWGGYTDLSINSYFKIDNVGHLYYCGDYTGVNLYHLHQLQNLYFALTGTELEIDINKLK